MLSPQERVKLCRGFGRFAAMDSIQRQVLAELENEIVPPFQGFVR
jgi:hypothetical protein